MDDPNCMRELPRYKCHKEVWALKIDKIENGCLYPSEEGYAPFHVGLNYVMKHNPEPGGYYVVYKDGYKSYSPASAFEEGYSAIS